MKAHRVKTFKPANLRYTERHKCSTYDAKKHIRRWFYVYCENTNLHGFRYISMAESTIFEAIFWLVICVSSIIFCVILMGRIWDNYSKHPITTTISTSDPITDLLYPAVLICNNNKIYRPQAEIIAKLLHENGFTEEESEMFFQSLPKLILADKVFLDNVTALRILDTLGMSVETLMEKLMQPCSAFLVRCGWVGRLFDCNKIFKTIKSMEGFCCAFNFHYNLTLHFEDDNMFDTHVGNDDSVDSDDNQPHNPLPGVANILNVPGYGRDTGLTVALNIERDTYKAVTRPFAGATVMVHDPIDYPAVGSHNALSGHILFVSVSCAAIHGTESLQNLSVDKRMCYTKEEMITKAKMISNEVRYNYESCVTTCIGRYVVQECGCLPIFFPEIYGARTCYLPDVECILKLADLRSVISINRTSRMLRDRVLKFPPPPPSPFEIFDIKSRCRECLPECTDLLFSTSAESVELDKTLGFQHSLLDGLDLVNISVIQVFFDNMFYVHYHKESTISWDALLASFGGIFGLCLGGSVISVIELVYLLIRKFFRRQSRKRQETFYNSLPPASKIFLSISAKKGQETQSQEKLHDGRDSVARSTFRQHKATNDYMYYKHKF